MTLWGVDDVAVLLIELPLTPFHPCSSQPVTEACLHQSCTVWLTLWLHSFRALFF